MQTDVVAVGPVVPVVAGTQGAVDASRQPGAIGTSGIFSGGDCEQPASVATTTSAATPTTPTRVTATRRRNGRQEKSAPASTISEAPATVERGGGRRS